MSNVLDFRSKVKSNDQAGKAESTKTTGGNPVGASSDQPLVDFTQRRQEVLNRDRRSVKRTILTEFISVHTLVPGLGLMKVQLTDINGGGIAFDLEEKCGHFLSGEEVAMRVYLNHKTYFPFTVKIKHVNQMADEGIYRHGAEFIPDSVNQVALGHFVSFMENVAASLKSDKGDVIVTKINS